MTARTFARVAAQARLELLLTLRRGESVLVAVGIPVGVLVFFSFVDVLPLEGPAPDALVPGILALSVVASGLVSLGIATAFERQAGVLKRVGVTPLGRSGLLAAKAISLGVLLVLQTGAVAGAAAALGWRPVMPPQAVGVLLLGTLAFASLGFLMAGSLRAETTLAVANAAFLLLLLLGGIIVPASSLPGPLEALAQVLPAEPLASGLAAALGAEPVPVSSLATLGVWALGACALATRTFRWEP